MLASWARRSNISFVLFHWQPPDVRHHPLSFEGLLFRCRSGFLCFVQDALTCSRDSGCKTPFILLLIFADLTDIRIRRPFPPRIEVERRDLRQSRRQAKAFIHS
jgi:hypothetical protein